MKATIYALGCNVGNVLVGDQKVSCRPIFVTGNGRSGTTWLGETFGRAPDVLYYNEPCHPGRNRLPAREVDPVWSRYLTPGERDPFFEKTLDEAFKGHIWRGSSLKPSDFLRRVTTRPRIVVKEVASFLSLPWVVDRWDPEVLIILRHPAAYAASVRGLKQDEAEVARLALLRKEPRLREQYLSDVTAHIDSISDPLEAAVASWAIRTRVILSESRSYPEWKFIRYEDLANRPVEEFKKLYDQLGLEWTPEIEAWILEHTQSSAPVTVTTRKSSEQIWRWAQKLSSEDVARIRRILEPFQIGLYGSVEDWKVPAEAGRSFGKCGASDV